MNMERLVFSYKTNTPQRQRFVLSLAISALRATEVKATTKEAPSPLNKKNDLKQKKIYKSYMI